MKVALAQVENVQTFDIMTDEGVLVDGVLTNKTTGNTKGFVFETEEYKAQYSAAFLRAIADKLDELNECHGVST